MSQTITTAAAASMAAPSAPIMTMEKPTEPLTPPQYVDENSQLDLQRLHDCANNHDHKVPAAQIDALLRLAAPAFNQHPMSLTLDGPALVGSAVVLVLAIHLLHPTVVKLAVAVVPLVVYVHNDYRNFLNLGRGGTPYNFAGYLWLTWLSFFTIGNPFEPPEPPPSELAMPDRGLLLASRPGLPLRPGPRPSLVGLAPHRQLDQWGSDEHFNRLRHALWKTAQKYPDILSAARSFQEKYGLALFVKQPVAKLGHGEVAHVHASDHSLHVSLHPDDIKEIIEKRRGERHPLGSTSPLVKMPVTPYMCMVYAPRNDIEYRIVCKIIEAAIWAQIGQEINLEA